VPPPSVQVIIAFLRQRVGVLNHPIGIGVSTPRPKHFLKFGTLRIIDVLRLLLGVEVIEIAEELVEAVGRREKLVAVAQVILAELAGRVAERFSGLRHAGILRPQPYTAPGCQPCQSSADGRLPVMNAARRRVQLCCACKW
jgi:hypothetical protein